MSSDIFKQAHILKNVLISIWTCIQMILVSAVAFTVSCADLGFAPPTGQRSNLHLLLILLSAEMLVSHNKSINENNNN